MSKRKDIGAFGDPSYLVKKFADISKATCSDRSAFAREVKALVESKATKKDGMHVYGAFKVSGVCDGEQRDGYVVHVAMGLNGPGRGSDYAAALKRLMDTKKFILIDAHIDAADDLWDFLLTYKAGEK